MGCECSEGTVDKKEEVLSIQDPAYNSEKPGHGRQNSQLSAKNSIVASQTPKNRLFGVDQDKYKSVTSSFAATGQNLYFASNDAERTIVEVSGATGKERQFKTNLTQPGTSSEWVTVQVGQDLFQARAQDSRWIRQASKFQKSERAEPMDSDRKLFAMANVENKCIIVSGGIKSDGFSAKALELVERYNIVTDSWETLPSLKRARQAHASVSLGDTVYVFCGANSDSEPMCSVEYLLNASGPIDQLDQWQQIPIL